MWGLRHRGVPSSICTVWLLATRKPQLSMSRVGTSYQKDGEVLFRLYLKASSTVSLLQNHVTNSDPQAPLCLSLSQALWDGAWEPIFFTNSQIPVKSTDISALLLWDILSKAWVFISFSVYIQTLRDFSFTSSRAMIINSGFYSLNIYWVPDVCRPLRTCCCSVAKSRQTLATLWTVAH